MSNRRKARGWAPDPAGLARLDQAAMHDGIDVSQPWQRAVLAATTSISYEEAGTPQMLAPVTVRYRELEAMHRALQLLSDQVLDLEQQLADARRAAR